MKPGVCERKREGMGGKEMRGEIKGDRKRGAVSRAVLGEGEKEMRLSVRA